jgi:hypothetical protein
MSLKGHEMITKMMIITTTPVKGRNAKLDAQEENFFFEL